MNTRPESFYSVFDYTHMMHDAIDHGLVYEECKITSDIKTTYGHKLIKDQFFDAVWFMFDTQEFRFVVWEKVSDFEWQADKNKSVIIPQSELAPFLKW